MNIHINKQMVNVLYLHISDTVNSKITARKIKIYKFCQLTQLAVATTLL